MCGNGDGSFTAFVTCDCLEALKAGVVFVDGGKWSHNAVRRIYKWMGRVPVKVGRALAHA